MLRWKHGFSCQGQKKDTWSLPQLEEEPRRIRRKKKREGGRNQEEEEKKSRFGPPRKNFMNYMNSAKYLSSAFVRSNKKSECRSAAYARFKAMPVGNISLRPVQ